MSTQLDAYGIALLMIAHGCDNPAGMAQAALDKFKEDDRPFDVTRDLRARFPAGMTFSIAHDGFHGPVIGHYRRLDGIGGIVGQLRGTNIVHVYGEKWL